VEPVKVLDLCAAPGGKSTHLLSILPENSLVVSNEVVPSRNKILQQNIMKWGNENAVVTQNDAAAFKKLPGFFDIIIADAPCSGEGLFRKQPDAVDEWSVENVKHCAMRQSVILEDVIASLKTGGYLVYCTCTFENSENEDQVQRLVDHHEMEHVELDAVGGIVKTGYGLRFYPHRVKGEGFFISLLRKKGASEKANGVKKSKEKPEKNISIENYLQEPGNYFLFRLQDEVYAFPDYIKEAIFILKENLFVRKAGIHVGTMKGKDLIPSQDLALSVKRKKELPK
jgi:hypothetical protein